MSCLSLPGADKRRLPLCSSSSVFMCVCLCRLQAGTVRDSMAKSLYSALFDWIVFRTNHALLNNKDLEDNSKVPMKIFFFFNYKIVMRRWFLVLHELHALLLL